MKDNNIKRLSRLTSLLMQLQTKRLSTAPELARKFDVSIRTIYRDIKALEGAGVPVLTEEGKGFSLMEGYKMPPVMFTETEANALITAEKIVLSHTDQSLSKAYTEAIEKIKVVLQYSAKDKVELLSKRIAVKPDAQHQASTHLLAGIESAITSLQMLKIVYRSGSKEETTERIVEPFALYNDLHNNWLLIAYCRLRKDYRMFHLSRIIKMEQLLSTFAKHTLTLEEFIRQKKGNFLTPDISLS